jgi:hypothetical protein
MTLSALIKKVGLANTVTATPATTATQEVDKPVTVAPVATVDVAVKQEPLPELSLDQEASIRAWLALIDETDPDIIAEILNQCHDELGARRYFLKRSEEVPETVPKHERITCGGCTYYERIEHSHLGHCTLGEPETIAGIWDSDLCYCEQFFAGTKQSTGIQSDTRKDKYEVKTP